MTVFALKITAMASMICDHLGYWLYHEMLIGYELYRLMRCAGRLAFPIFAFLIANGYEHTSDKIKYLYRLICFAALSQLPFSMVFTAGNYSASLFGGIELYGPNMLYVLFSLAAGFLWYRYVWSRWESACTVAAALILGSCGLSLGRFVFLSPNMNVFYTLALGLALMAVAAEFSVEKRQPPGFYGIAAALLCALIVVGNRADYGINGIILIFLFRLFRDSREKQLLMLLLWALLQYSPWAGTGDYFISAVLAAIPLALYRRQAGRPVKSLFYLVYPLHLLLIGILIIL